MANPQSSTLGEAYRHYRRAPGSSHTALNALTLARAAVAAGRTLFPETGSTWNPPFAAFGERHLRWIESPAAAGLRFVGFADELDRGIQHTGWWLDEYGAGETVRGVVYQLPGRNGRPLYVPGYADPYNGSADKGGPACLSFDEIFEGEAGDSYSGRADQSARVEAARRADRIAEVMAERERERDSAWQAGCEFAALGDVVASERRATLRLIADLKQARRETWADRTVADRLCGVIRDEIGRKVEAIREARKRRNVLRYGDAETLGYDRPARWFEPDDLRDAFREGAGLPLVEGGAS